jgi:hypothetical protein
MTLAQKFIVSLLIGIDLQSLPARRLSQSQMAEFGSSKAMMYIVVRFERMRGVGLCYPALRFRSVKESCH